MSTLYDLADDPTEENNLYRDRQEHVSELREKAEEAAEAYEGRRVDDGGEAVEYEDEEVVKKLLEDLGYR
ncbi:MAG: hypothetical protein U5J64_03345 [Halobacteriales archaeon]|nr:hypothetical protein [Halobacteriales archaeon]